MTPQAVRRNIRRHIRQVWSYIDAELAEKHDVCPGIIFSHQPKDPGLVQSIEEAFFAEGIPVVWDDETVDQCKARKIQSVQKASEE